MCVCVAISFTNVTRVSLSTVFALHLTYPKPNDPFHKPLIINAVEEKCIPCLSAAKQQPVTEVIVGSYSRKFITRPAPSPRILHYTLDLPRNLCCHSVFVRVPTITLIKFSGSRVAPVLLTPAAQKIHLALSLSPHTNKADRTPSIWRTVPEGLHVWGCFCWCSLGESKQVNFVWRSLLELEMLGDKTKWLQVWIQVVDEEYWVAWLQNRPSSLSPFYLRAVLNCRLLWECNYRTTCRFG